MTAILRALSHITPDLRVLGDAFGTVWQFVGSSFVQAVAQWAAGQ